MTREIMMIDKRTGTTEPYGQRRDREPPVVSKPDEQADSHRHVRVRQFFGVPGCGNEA